jgi:hypothetical protein
VADLGYPLHGVRPPLGRTEIGHHVALVEVDTDDAVAGRSEASYRGGADARGGSGDGDVVIRQLDVP